MGAHPFAEEHREARRLLAVFLRSISPSGSTSTRRNYGAFVALWLRTVRNPFQPAPLELEAFLHSRVRGKGELRPGSVSFRMDMLHAFYRFLVRMEALPADPTAHLRRPRANAPAPRGLGMENARALLAACQGDTRATRDRAIVLTMLLMGIRRGELCSLTIGSLSIGPDGSLSTITYRAKGGIERRQALPPPVAAAISEHLQARGPLGSLPEDASIFGVTWSGLRGVLERRARLAGIGRITPHQLRHTAAQLHLRAGASLPAVGALLGHANLQTTDRYLRALQPDLDPSWAPIAAALEAGKPGSDSGA